MKTDEEIIECKICTTEQLKLSIGSDVMYVNKKTKLCKADSTIEDKAIVIREMKTPDDVVKLHRTLESIFG